MSLVTLEIFTRPSVTERDASKTKCQLLSSYPHLSSMSCHLTKLAISGYTQNKYANNSTISMDPRQFEGHFQFHLSPEDTLNNYNRLNFELFSFWIFRKLQIKSFKRRQWQLSGIMRAFKFAAHSILDIFCIFAVANLILRVANLSFSTFSNSWATQN